MKYIVSKRNKKILFYSSFKTIISIITSFYYNKRDFTFLTIILLFTSLNYWRKPNYGVRRNIDIFWSCFVMLYHLKKSFNLRFNSIRYYYIITFFFNIYLYFLGKITLKEIDGVKYHCKFHTIGNLSNIILYKYLE